MSHTRQSPAAAWDGEVTEIIPFNEFGMVGDLEFRAHCAFDADYQVMHARELDDLDGDDDQVPLLLRAAPVDQRARSRPPPAASSAPSISAGSRPAGRTRGGMHRQSPAGTSAGRSRLMLAAIAAGAAAAATQSAVTATDASSGLPVLAADALSITTVGVRPDAPAGGMQVVAASPPVDPAQLRDEFARAAAFAAQRAEREALLRTPLYVMPTVGVLTSDFGMRWGALHGGIDIANAIGTPIYAVAAGMVIDAGPTAGFGMWVRVRHPDGTVSLYGHINSTTVTVGERVLAGDQVATMGNNGFSTGPHLHFEVQLNGADRIDPVPWLAQHGVNTDALAG